MSDSKLTLPSSFNPFYPQAPFAQNMFDPNSPPSIQNIMYLMNLRNSLQEQVRQLQFTALMGSASLMQAKQPLTLATPPMDQSPMVKVSPDSPPESTASTTNSDCTMIKIEAGITENVNSLPDDPEICLEAQIKYMVQFFVNNFGTATDSEVQAERKKFAKDARLEKIFDALVSKYTATTKTREEMVKWVVRRALKSCKQLIKRGQKISPKKVVKDLCDKYFVNGEKVKEASAEEPEQFSSLLPFRKNSKNKTMNATFINEIFASEDFRQDYQCFLTTFDDITDKDTANKSTRFIKFLIECIKKDSVKNIAKYKRVPWLKVWVSNTKKVAVELERGGIEEKYLKKIKLEEKGEEDD